MFLFKSRFKYYLRASALLVLFGFICLDVGLLQVVAQKKVSEQDRRNARVQATYIARLVTFIRWEQNETEEIKDFKIVVLGDENLGLVQSLNFLVEQSNLSSDGPPVSVIHYPNSQSKAALEFINEGTEFVYFTRDCKLTTKEVIPLRNGALLLSEGREFVENENGCIAFEQRRNRIKLIVNEKCFNRKFAKVNPILTSLRSVVEVVNPSL